MQKLALVFHILIGLAFATASSAQFEFVDDYATGATHDDIFWKGLPSRWGGDFTRFCDGVESHSFSKRYLALTKRIFELQYVSQEPTRALYSRERYRFDGGGSQWSLDNWVPKHGAPRWYVADRSTFFIGGAGLSDQSRYDDGNVRFTLDMPLHDSNHYPWQTPTNLLLREWLEKAFTSKYEEAEQLNKKLTGVQNEINERNKVNRRVDLEHPDQIPSDLQNAILDLASKGMIALGKQPGENGGRLFATGPTANKTINMIAWCANRFRGMDEYRLVTMSGPSYAQYASGCADPNQLLCSDVKFELCKESLSTEGLVNECKAFDWRKPGTGPGGVISGDTMQFTFPFGGLVGIFALGGEKILNSYGNQVLDLWEARLKTIEDSVGADKPSDTNGNAEVMRVYEAKRVVEECYNLTRRKKDPSPPSLGGKHLVSDKELDRVRFRWGKFADRRSQAPYGENLLQSQWTLQTLRLAVLGTNARPHSSEDIASCKTAASDFLQLTPQW